MTEDVKLQKPLNEAIGDQVKRYRTTLKMTQQELGRRLGAEMGETWSRQTVWEAEAGKRDFKIQELIGLARVARVPLRFFFDPAGTLDEVSRPGTYPLTRDDLKDLFRSVGTRPERYRDVRAVLDVLTRSVDAAREQLKLMDNQVYDTATGEVAGKVEDHE